MVALRQFISISSRKTLIILVAVTFFLLLIFGLQTQINQLNSRTNGFGSGKFT